MIIKHVYGNVLRIDIPLTIKIRTIEEGTPSEREEPFYPDATKGCIVELANNYNRKIEYKATIKDNIVHMEDNGEISIGRYKITVKCYDADGNPYRYMARDIVEICDATADAGIEAGVEFNAETHTLEGAVFISYVSGSFEQVQADWAEADIHSKAYIKNKPTNLVEDENYVHTDNNYTSEEKKKLADLHNYDDATVRQLIADTNANFANYYDKQESYSAVEIDTMLSTQRQGRFVISEELPVASADTMFKIYLIPSESAKEANVKDEFITLQNGEDEYSWEQVGSTAVDLSGYSTTEEMNTAISAALSSYYSKTDIDGKLSEISTALGERYTKTEIDGKLDNKQDSISDLNDIRSGAAKGSTAYQKPAGGIPASDIASGVLPNVSDKESKMAIVETDSSDTIQAEVGKCYTFSQDVNTLAISLPAPTEKRRIGNIMMYFKTGATPAVTITSEETLLYQDGYKIDANTRYELNCLFNGKEWVVAVMKIGEE